MPHPLAFANQYRVIINPLTRQDFPMIKPRRLRLQMPFPNHRRRVTGRLQQLGKRCLRTIKTAVAIVIKPVDVAIRARENRGPRRTAQGIVHQTAVKPHAFVRQPVNVRRLDQMPLLAICAHRLPRMVIRHDEQNVRPRRCRQCRHRQEQSRQNGVDKTFHDLLAPPVAVPGR